MDQIKNKKLHIKMTRADPDWDPTSFGFDLSATEGGTRLNSRTWAGQPAMPTSVAPPSAGQCC